MTLEIDDVVAQGRLTRLRRKRSSDVEADYAWRCDPELARFDAAPPLRVALSDFRATYEEDLRYPGQFRRVYAIESLDGQHIGNVMYYNLDAQRGEAELGITIGDRRYWGAGYGRDAVRIFVKHLCESVGLKRVYLNTLDWNVRAQQAFRAAGFVAYGVNHRGLHTFMLMEIRRDWLSESEEQPAPEADS